MMSLNLGHQEGMNEPMASPRSRPQAQPSAAPLKSADLAAPKKEGKIMLSPRGRHAPQTYTPEPSAEAEEVKAEPAPPPPAPEEPKEETPKEEQKPVMSMLNMEKKPLNRQPSRGLPFATKPDGSPMSARGAPPVPTMAASARGPPPNTYGGLSARPANTSRSGGATARGAALQGMTLVQLCELKQKGMFSDAEFVTLKMQLLADL